jgi:hypothetical protein
VLPHILPNVLLLGPAIVLIVLQKRGIGVVLVLSLVQMMNPSVLLGVQLLGMLVVILAIVVVINYV